MFRLILKRYFTPVSQEYWIQDFGCTTAVIVTRRIKLADLEAYNAENVTVYYYYMH